MADTIKTNLGPVTAYADAKAHGYTGTREEFGQLLANAGLNLKAAETAKADAEAAKQAAETAQQAAAENQKNAGTQAANAKASADTAAEQAAVAEESAADAANSATAAQESENNAGLSATAAANAEAAAKQAQNAAETAKADAETANTAAGNSADAAANSAADAKKTLESIPADYSTLSGKVNENASEISQLKEDIENIAKDKYLTIKRYDSTCIDGQMIRASDGDTQSVSTHFCTDYIDISNISSIHLTMITVEQSGTSGIAFYDAEKKFVRGYYNRVTGIKGYEVRDIEVPINAAYVRSSFYKEFKESYFIGTYDYELKHQMELTKNIPEILDYQAKDEKENKKIIHEVQVRYEFGSFNENGDDVESTTKIRANGNVDTPNGDNIIIIVPNGIKTTMNVYNKDSSRRKNIFYHNSVIIRDNTSDYVRIAFSYEDDSDIGNIEEFTKNIRIFVGASKSSDYDITISAVDSEVSDKIKSDIVLDGLMDTEVIQMVFASSKSIKCLLYGGTYNVNRIHATKYDKPCAFSTNQNSIEGTRLIELYGNKKGRLSNTNTVRFFLDQSLYDSIDSETAIFLVPRAAKAEDTKETYSTCVVMENINIVGCGYDKPIVYMDFTQAKSCSIVRCNINSTSYYTGTIPKFDHAPNGILTGIRTGHGSNNGIGNFVKNCSVFYCYTGVSCCGEHYIFEDVLVHHCYVGFAFGDKLTRTNYEHPNIMIGCSIEGCKRMMILSKYGETTETTGYEPSNTLICIGLSMEASFYDPDKDLSVATSTLPILEITKGAYRGRIEADFSTTRPLAEKGSCENMILDDKLKLKRGQSSSKPNYNLLQPGTMYYDTDLQKYLYSTESGWVELS